MQDEHEKKAILQIPFHSSELGINSFVEMEVRVRATMPGNRAMYLLNPGQVLFIAQIANLTSNARTETRLPVPPK